MNARAKSTDPTNPMSITLVTCDREPVLTASDRLVAAELIGRGCTVRVARWSDPDVDWTTSACTVLRSPWDASARPEEFLKWLALVERQTILVNAPALVRWNFDKRYLLALEANSIPIISTQYWERGQAISGWMAPWDEVVVKPVIGASSVGVGQFKLPQQRLQMERHATILLEQTGVLLQRYEPSVRTAMERSLVFIAGAYSHAVRRIPFNLGTTPDTDEFDHEASIEEIQLARRALAAARADAVPYARVDLLPTNEGLVLMELELIDPALFLTRRPAAAAELAAALVACAR